MIISVLTLNVQGLRALASRQTLMAWINCFRPDIICLQETHSKSETEFSQWFSSSNTRIRNIHNYQCVSSPGRARSCGVAILYQPNLELLHVARDTAGRLVVADFCINGYSFQTACIYAPNTKAPGCLFFESIYPILSSDLPVFLCGDFNTVVDAHKDRFGCNPTSPWAYNWSPTLTDLTSSFDLSDSWRSKHPDSSDFTWRRGDGSQGSRIDMVWIPRGLLDCVKSVEILPFFRSDHSYVFLEFNPPAGIERGKGIWKFNTSHLEDEAFCHKIEEFWAAWQRERSRFTLPSSWWDAGKVRIKRLIREYSRAKAQEHLQKVKSLNCAIYHAQRRVDLGDLEFMETLADFKEELSALLLKEARGAQLRACVQWAEEGETSTAYFLRQGKTVGKRRLIGRIKRPDGSVAQDTKGILGVWQAFYLDLYSSIPLDVSAQSRFLDHLERSLSPSLSARCDGDVTEDECFQALTDMANARSPGTDGLPAEFFKHFWHLLGPDLVAVFNSCFLHQRLSPSQRSAVITLLFKKGDHLETKNWRPISLLCTDYKILAKALSNRLLKVIHHVISPDQTCGVPGRFMGENVRLIHDVVHFANSNDIPSAILTLDQEKAFDRVEWSYLQKVLKKMGFGDSFCSWVSLLYNGISSSVLVNGFLSEAFSVFRGVRQGCPLSPLLYVLVAESLACAIRADPAIDGFPLPGSDLRSKLTQYADDTTTFVTSDSAILALFRLFEHYERASGAKLNSAKCKGLLLGPWRSRTSFPVALQWTSDSITCLGSRVANDGLEDWTSHTERLKVSIAKWKHRTLSLRGRALIVNILGLSTFWYLASVVFMPTLVVTEINKLIFPFVWAKKREWLARSSVTKPSNIGGLGVVDVSSKIGSLHVLWMKRFLCGSRHGWHFFFDFQLRKAFDIPSTLSTIDFLRSGHLPAYRVKRLPPFYRSVVSSWTSLNASFESLSWAVPFSGSSFPLSELTASKAYSILRSKSDTPHRCIDKYSTLGIGPLIWKQVWLLLDLWRFLRPVRDTNWLLFHGILPTKDRLIRFGMSVDPWCSCGARETLLHLFVLCPIARAVIHWFTSIFNLFDPSVHNFSPTLLLFGFSQNPTIPMGFSALLGIIRHRLWLMRNAYTFDHIAADVPLAISRIKSSFRFLLRVQQRNCPPMRFLSGWLAGGILGTPIHPTGIVFCPSLTS